MAREQPRGQPAVKPHASLRARLFDGRSGVAAWYDEGNSACVGFLRAGAADLVARLPDEFLVWLGLHRSNRSVKSDSSCSPQRSPDFLHTFGNVPRVNAMFFFFLRRMFLLYTRRRVRHERDGLIAFEFAQIEYLLFLVPREALEFSSGKVPVRA